MYQVRTRLGSSEVIASQTIVCDEFDTVDIIIGPDPSPYQIELTFAPDTNAASVEVSVVGQSQMRVAFKNFGGSLGSATVTPLYVGNLASRKLLISLATFVFASSEEKSIRLLSYTLMVGGPPDE